MQIKNLFYVYRTFPDTSTTNKRIFVFYGYWKKKSLTVAYLFPFLFINLFSIYF